MEVSTQTGWKQGDAYFITNGTHTVCKVKHPDGWAFEAWRLAPTGKRGTFSTKLGHWIYGDEGAKAAKLTAYQSALATIDADIHLIKE
jgi:hypothetical protein